MKKKGLIIDGNNILFKAYHATAYSNLTLHSKAGSPTNAVYGFIRMISKFLTNNHYDAVFVAFDAGKTTFRTKILPTYKANRKSTPHELITQFALVKEFLDLADIRWKQLENYEADDLIATVIKNQNNEEYDIDIISNDKDLYQLLSNNVKILAPEKGLSVLKSFDIKTLKTQYELKPEQIPDLKGLMGDSSDNLPGIKGIGIKTALKLLKTYGSLEKIIDNQKKLTPKEQKLIENEIEIALLTKKLATIDNQVPITTNLDNCYYDVKKLQNESLQIFFQKYNMRSLLKKQTIIESNLAPSEIKIINLWQAKYNAQVNYLWTEIGWDNYHQNPILALGIKNDNGTFYLNSQKIAQDRELKSFLENKTCQKITWDIKKNIISLKKHFNINCNGFIFDHMLACYLLYANENINYQNMAQVLNYQLSKNDDEVYGKASKKKVPDDEILIAKLLEVKLNFLKQTYDFLVKKLKDTNNWNLYQEIELPTVYPLITMEKNGIMINTTILETIKTKTAIKINKMEAEINEMCEEKINPNSPKQISELLFQKLNLRSYKKNNSTAFDVLLQLQGKHPIINILICYRKMQKLYSTYLVGLEKYLDHNNKIHTIYNQVQASTGRISSIEPNMQNITIRNEQQKEVRKIFVPSKSGYKIVACDYSQIELRILAHISEDPTLINAFMNNDDIHLDTAKKIFNLKAEDISSKERTKAKAVNFGIIYGISGYGLAKQLNISIKEAKNFIDRYFAIYPQISNYIKKSISFCEQFGYVKSLYGRKREVPEIYSNNNKTKEFGERIAINMPIQGTAADIIKLAMIKIDKAIKANKIDAILIAQVHDELIFEVKTDKVAITTAQIVDIMSNIIKLKIPLVINTSYGDNWYELK